MVHSCGGEVRGLRTQTYRVNLSQDQRERLLDLARRGKSSARKVKRSLILCKADEGLAGQQVSEALLVSPSTVYRVRLCTGSVGASLRKERRVSSTSGRGLDSGASLMGSKKPTWWLWPAAKPPKGIPTGRCNCWPTRWSNWSSPTPFPWKRCGRY